MNQTFATTLFYGDTSINPERFMGLAPRFSSLSAENAENIVNGSGSGSDNASIWLIVWGPKVFTVYIQKVLRLVYTIKI